MTQLEVAPRAEAQIRAISEWWRANRQAAPDLFVQELATALDTLVGTPGGGAKYSERRGVEIRRVLLQRSRHHVYFSYDEQTDIVSVRAVWHGARGKGPPLG